MKSSIALSALLAGAAVVLASGPPATPFEVCAASSTCLAAAAAWNDCTNHYLASTIQVLKPGSYTGGPDENVRDCLCQAGLSVPAHPEWSQALIDCATCIDRAITLGGTFSGVSGSVFMLTGSPLAFEGLCAVGSNTYYGTVSAMKTLQHQYKFPLMLPEAVLDSPHVIPVAPTNPIVSLSTVYACAESSSASPSPQSLISSPTQKDVAPIIPTPPPFTGTTTTAAVPASSLVCNEDNCFRQLYQSAGVAEPFCSTYTQIVNTATTGLPDFVSMCVSQPTQISSACSCVVASTTAVASATSTALGAFTTTSTSTSTSCTDEASPSSTATALGAFTTSTSNPNIICPPSVGSALVCLSFPGLSVPATFQSGHLPPVQTTPVSQTSTALGAFTTTSSSTCTETPTTLETLITRPNPGGPISSVSPIVQLTSISTSGRIPSVSPIVQLTSISTSASSRRLITITSTRWITVTSNRPKSSSTTSA